MIALLSAGYPIWGSGLGMRLTGVRPARRRRLPQGSATRGPIHSQWMKKVFVMSENMNEILDIVKDVPNNANFWSSVYSIEGTSYSNVQNSKVDRSHLLLNDPPNQEQCHLHFPPPISHE